VYRYYDRVTYWLDRPYNLGEIYRANGELVEIYLHVASVPTLTRDGIAFTDYELDVVKHPGRPAEIVDQDEFEEAVERYGYSPEFQARCYRIAEEAAELAARWLPGKPPTQR
jgi:predicted RNA-binding protein associated with RNAse of E/G family